MKKLYELAMGEHFRYGGVAWVSLEKKGSFCITADVLKNADGSIRTLPFDTGWSNNFASSSIRAWLEGTFLQELLAAGASEEAFWEIRLDLTSCDAFDDYGIHAARVALPSCELYRWFRRAIPNASSCWWTCTPSSIAQDGHPYNVRCANEQGVLGDCGVKETSIGVRPICALRPNTLVSCCGEENDETATLADKYRETLGLLELAVDALKALNL